MSIIHTKTACMRSPQESTATHAQQEEREKSLRKHKFARNMAGELNWATRKPIIFKAIRINRKTCLKGNSKKENRRKSKVYWLFF